ncbi:MAG: hypothetical protein A3H51_00510 [Candidatus Spechtbacteria bacterium RIFCSPLOWO2_02_FULL_38_8]|uniref:Aspartyl/glutamyl-tRNA(Asn/Gln) amidotransferase subunit C n=1 Tax=Candidatus Spechtbacteria bacterium RIFCSPLOWO2_02_FULL_38_8 TaxID=1802164 RepID=A0A1G2HKA8_9BACT|nr:MAG: hypothetical protein A3H51_00510 [Candidatus Spechtbacteria bacterium RIFCSPLOWO2_02_FULL_38_8]
MSKLLKQEVVRIAQLARLKISDKDSEYYSEELSAILSYINQLEKLDTQDIESTSNIGGLDSVTRKDEVYDEQHKRKVGISEVLMELVPFVKSGFTKVKSVFNKQ